MRLENVTVEILPNGNFLLEKNTSPGYGHGASKRHVVGGVLPPEATKEIKRVMRLMEGTQR